MFGACNVIQKLQLENSKLPLFVKISKRTRADDSSAVLEKRTADMLRGWDFSFYSMSLIFSQAVQQNILKVQCGTNISVTKIKFSWR